MYEVTNSRPERHAAVLLLTSTPTALISKVLIARDALNAHVYEELA